ncbi:MAG: protein translocase subunit SecF [gamma proteobacterium symbiont of Bathyaustriella thionipta]|nr:protein translocase subunit SecF [gamma proteobacterium symbiont of Bathyaustriella thionipta]
MELISNKLNIDFMGRRKIALIVSSLFIIVSLASLLTQGLKFGIDFTGGTLVEVGYAQPVELEGVRSALAEGGFDKAIVQYFGNSQDVLINVPPTDGKDANKLSDEVFRTLKVANQGNEVKLRRAEFVGPQVGEELTEDGGLAMIYALGGILLYVAFRFEYRFAIGSVVALIHDVIITLGVFSLLQIEFDLTVLAAILAVIGYSLNDTIVVFDRIRENFRRVRHGETVEIINVSLNQTLSRTLMTSVTTLLVLIALLFLGGEIIFGFSLALIIGVVVGTYSSIYVAGTTLILLGVNRTDMMPVEKEGADQNAAP